MPKIVFTLDARRSQAFCESQLEASIFKLTLLIGCRKTLAIACA